MRALYNEIDPFAAAWLRNLAAAGHVAAGTVEERSIRELRAKDVQDATQAHFFAGIGVWSYALKLAGVPDDVPIWTGSCPCQPFSAAGKRGGTTDPRHLWPEWFGLIRECRPSIVFGEQVASAGDWLDLVSSDLEGEGYAFGAAVLGSHSVGAPHIRQRLYFVAYANEAEFCLERSSGLLDGERQAHGNDAHGRGQDGGALAYASGDEQRARRPGEAGDGRDAAREQPAGLRDAGLVADSLHAGRPERWALAGDRPPAGSGSAGELEHSTGEQVGLPGLTREPRGSLGELGNPGSEGLPDGEPQELQGTGRREEGRATGESGSSFWSDAEWIPCRDGKQRPVEPGTFPLAHGAASRVGRLRAYGNALNAQQAACFIRAAMSGARRSRRSAEPLTSNSA